MGNFLKSAAPVIGTVAGGALGGPMGAMAGGALGSAISKSGGRAITGGAGISTPNLPQGYQPTGQAQMDQYYQQLVQNMTNNNIPQQLYPQIQQYTNQFINNPYAAGNQAAAGAAGQAATGIGQQNIGAANQMYGAGNQLLQLGSDPQNALYNRTLQQLQDQTRSGLEARGLDTSGVGAGLENQALSNFNIDWQNNQLNRALQGAQGAAGAYGSGSNIGGAGVSDIAAGGSIPYSTYGQNTGTILDALNNQMAAGQAGQNWNQNTIGDLQNYLSLGQSATGMANNAAQQNYLNQVLRANQQQRNVGSLFGSIFPGGLSTGGSNISSGFSNFLGNAPSSSGTWLNPNTGQYVG